jgi:hypothetical protein
MEKERPDAVIVQPSLPSKRAAELALKHRVPAVSVPRWFAEEGVEVRKCPVESGKHLVDDAADQPQWMVSGYSLFKVHIGKQFTRPHIRTAHRFLLLSSPA